MLLTVNDGISVFVYFESLSASVCVCMCVLKRDANATQTVILN